MQSLVTDHSQQAELVSHDIACNLSFLVEKKSDLITRYDPRSKHNQRKSKRSEQYASVASTNRVGGVVKRIGN